MPNLTAQAFKTELQKYAKVDDAGFLQGFFKTGEGQYGEGDVFIGVRVPQTREVCRQFKDLSLAEVKKLLASDVHEHRLAAVILLSNRYKKATEPEKKAIYDLYLQAVGDGRVNNWDIVDSSAGYIVGEYLYERPRTLLFELAHSESVWARRVAIISTFSFIMKGDPTTTILIAEELLHDKHDLIHKAVGWMLREVGKRVDRQILLDFLGQHAHEMPRTMLRYSVEHLPPELRAKYMASRERG